MKKIYLDYAATTYLDSDVLSAMLPHFGQTFGNASSQHSFGRDALKALDTARDGIAECIGAKSSEIYFTSGGTESDNWAIKGIAYAHKHKGNHIITTKIEHPAVLMSCEYLEKQGFEVTYLPVDSDGLVSVDSVNAAITDKTILVSIMAANNEIGSIQPIAEIGKLLEGTEIFFHTDAVQAVAAIDINVNTMKLDLLSLSAHKFYGPKGVGILYIRNGTKIDRYMSGGEQERAMRAGTNNHPAIVGMSVALKKGIRNMHETNAKMSAMRDYLIAQIEKRVPYCKLNGSRKNRLVNNVNFSFEFVEGESLLLLLDLSGIAVSSGSACSSGSLEASHVLKAIGVNEEIIHGSVRFSLGQSTTYEDLDITVDVLAKSVAKLRAISPLFKQDKKGMLV